MNEVEHVLLAGNELGEGPLWHAGEGALYWVDIYGEAFHRLHVESGRHERFEVGVQVGVLAFRSGGGLLMATQNGFAFWDESAGKLDHFADPEADKPQSRFNDGAVDRNGRFWAGTMGDGAHNALYRLDPDGSIHTMETGVIISNGIGWSPDNRTMYYADSPRKVIYAYDYDAASGGIANRRALVQDEDPGVPDGLTVDEEGFIWSARWGGWCLNRYDPAGQLERKIAMPVEFPTSCIFGGPDLDTLYITSAWTELGEAGRADRPLDGDLFSLKTAVRGMPEPQFGG
jgi:sugar lactone lactonase YvrE